MADNVRKFGEHRRRREDDPTRVRCARCGKLIPMAATRCPECGVHFQGQAFQFSHASEHEGTSRRKSRLSILAAIVFLGVVLLGATALIVFGLK
jgi:uncharacterized membrane protein YvbJ